MARIRSIHPGLFTDEAFASLSMAARVLLLGIWTEADDHGVFEWKPVTLKMRVMPVDNVSIPDLLAECEGADVLKKFSEGKTYGLVRNFCRYQRPKKPKYLHPIPPQFFTYAGLNRDGTQLVLHQSRTGGETSPQREDGGGEVEEESGEGIEKGEGVRPARSDLRVVEEVKAVPIDAGYEPSDAAIEYAFSLGMKKKELTSELSKFVAKSMSLRVVSYNPDANFKVWCDRWLDFKRRDNPDWEPTPEPAPLPPPEPYVVVVVDTLEFNCWGQYQRANGLKPLFVCKQTMPNGTIVLGARCKTLFPPGYDDSGEIVGGDEAAA